MNIIHSIITSEGKNSDKSLKVICIEKRNIR